MFKNLNIRTYQITLGTFYTYCNTRVNFDLSKAFVELFPPPSLKAFNFYLHKLFTLYFNILI